MLAEGIIITLLGVVLIQLYLMTGRISRVEGYLGLNSRKNPGKVKVYARRSS